MSIQDNAFRNSRSIKSKFVSIFCEPTIKTIAFISRRVYRLSNVSFRFNTDKVHLCFSMLIRIKGYRIGYHLSPYCIKSRIFRGKHVQLIQINNWEICRDCLTKRPACKIYRIIAPLFGGFNTVGLRQSPYSFNRNNVVQSNTFCLSRRTIRETTTISIKCNCKHRFPNSINTCRFRCSTKVGRFRSPFGQRPTRKRSTNLCRRSNFVCRYGVAISQHLVSLRIFRERSTIGIKSHLKSIGTIP